jgi:hypothetical protein
MRKISGKRGLHTVMKMMARVDLYNIWKPFLVDAMQQAGIFG